MALDVQVIIKSLAPKMASKAMQTFDRATTIVVSACWGAAILMMAFAIYTMMLSLSAKRAAETAMATEPSLPKIIHKNIEPRTAQIMVERLQRLYPDVRFSLSSGQNPSLTVIAIDGSKFREWLTALSYIDTISPEYHWTLGSFCVGKCSGNEIMKAVLMGERISFEAPQL